MRSDHDEDHDQETAERFWQVRNIQLSAVAGVLLATGMVAGWRGSSPLDLIAFAAALVVGGSTFIPESLRGLMHRELGVGTLMTIAAIGAVALGQLGEAASLAFLFSIAEGLEAYSLSQARRGLRSLLALTPEVATRIEPSGEGRVPIGELRVGDRIVIRPGERVASDGVVRAGRSALDVSAITGESTRVEVNIGDEVFAGSMNGGGVLELQVTATAEDNSLARIVHIVEAAQERKGRGQRLADRIARPLVPGVMVVAAAAAVVGSLFGDPEVWIPRSLVILVAAAPCAFAISVPVTVVAAIGAATRGGALIKGGAALEALGGVRLVALDKTGTLTRNRPRVIAAEPVSGVSREELLALAAALEARSEHPLAPAILAAAPATPAARDVEAVPGRGLVGRVEGRVVRLGRPGFVDADGLGPAIVANQEAGASVVLVERDGETIGLIAVRDELRPEAAEVVDQLRAIGVEAVMLTGDNARTAAALAAGARIGRVEAELRPEDKARIVDQLRRDRRVAMVGDGINDAPALASADVGIAMGAMGSDVAIETADVALMGEDLRHLPALLRHGRHALGVMRQNLILSGAIIVVLIPLAAFGVLGLAAVVAVHEIAEVLVIGNGLRAGRTPRAASGAREPVLA
jgi:cation-transporting ATPase G